MAIGVLALQGDFRNHVQMLDKVGVQSRLIHSRLDLASIDGIIIPGGESTTISMLLESSDLFEPIAKMLGEGFPAFGTCAGMILLSSNIVDGRADQRAFGAIDIEVRRNGFGRQIASFETDINVLGIDGMPLKAAFIRAPVVEKVSPEVEVLATVEYSFPDSSTRSIPVICKQGKVLVSSFHPEIVGDERLHKLFLEFI